MFKHGNYIAKLEVNAEAGILHGRVLNISDVVVFEGTTVKEAEEAFYRAVENYIQTCQEQGKEPAKPFSGKLPFRTTPEIHRDIYIAATRADKSINAWMEEVLSDAAQQSEKLPNPTAIQSQEDCEISIAQYEQLQSQLQDKIAQLQNAIQPYLDKKPGSFIRLLKEIRPLLKDRDLPDLLEKDDALKHRLRSIQSQEEAFLSQMAETTTSPAAERSEGAPATPSVTPEPSITQPVT